GDVFATIAMPNNRQFFSREYEFRMGMRALKDALMLREYRLKNGKYPTSLSQAIKDSPEYNDIADGRPLRYELQKNTARLYSVGLNLKDDGGQGFSLVGNQMLNLDKEVKDDLWIELK
ncbi:MAG: hypothetical protein Q7W05_07485, partial [Deltaproteobacteria bacterium]|nr:hypothetical protein [Deltaproteobacteria bacterium]